MITEIELLSYPNLITDEELQIRDFLTKITLVGLNWNIKELAIAFRKNYRLRLALSNLINIILVHPQVV